MYGLVKNLPVDIVVMHDPSTSPPKGPGSASSLAGRLFLRRLSALTLFFSGLVLVATSLVLLAAPPAHVALFCDWRVLGLVRAHWNLLHVMSGLLFMVAMPLHIYFNWKAMFAFLQKRRSGGAPFFSRPLVAALMLTIYVCAGSFAGLPPMKQIIQGLRTMKIHDVHQYGAPPFGAAEQAPLAKVAFYLGWNPGQSLAALRQKGYRVESAHQSLKTVAENNGISLLDVLDGMRNQSPTQQK